MAGRAVDPLVARAWPAPVLTTARLLLRPPRPEDHGRFVDLYASPEVRAHLGGARPRHEVEQEMSVAPADRPGLFVVDQQDAMVGVVTLDGRDPSRPGPPHAELTYQLLPDAWGRGLATEACEAVLAWFAKVEPDAPVVLVTQVANTASRRLADRLGFVEVDRFDEFGEPQWCGVRRPVRVRTDAQ